MTKEEAFFRVATVSPSCYCMGSPRVSRSGCLRTILGSVARGDSAYCNAGLRDASRDWEGCYRSATDDLAPGALRTFAIQNCPASPEVSERESRGPTLDEGQKDYRGDSGLFSSVDLLVSVGVVPVSALCRLVFRAASAQYSVSRNPRNQRELQGGSICGLFSTDGTLRSREYSANLHYTLKGWQSTGNSTIVRYRT